MEAQTFTVFEVFCHIILFMMYGFIHSSKGFYGDIIDLIFILFKPETRTGNCIFPDASKKAIFIFDSCVRY